MDPLFKPTLQRQRQYSTHYMNTCGFGLDGSSSLFVAVIKVGQRLMQQSKAIQSIQSSWICWAE